MALGNNKVEYEVIEGWEQLPEGWSFRRSGWCGHGFPRPGLRI